MLLNDFFPQINNNLTKITWAHAVNNRILLNSVLKNDGVMMIEADVQLGFLINSSDLIPIMCHPPETTSDLSLESFLCQIDDFNSTNEQIKGIKLDFKSIKAYEKSIEVLKLYQKVLNEKKYPIWLNADILPCSETDSATVDCDKFIVLTKNHFTNVTLSLGWTTSDKTLEYTQKNIDNMIDLIKNLNVTLTLTFPVRASMTANSKNSLIRLIDNTDKSTLTVWHSNKDQVDVDKLKDVVQSVGVNRVYLDLPLDLMQKLDLNTC